MISSVSGKIIFTDMAELPLHLIRIVFLITRFIERSHQFREPQQVNHPKRRSTRRDRHIRIVSRRVRPACRQRSRLLATIAVEHPILGPTPAGLQELELTSEQRVERMGHPERSPLSRGIMCI